MMQIVSPQKFVIISTQKVQLLSLANFKTLAKNSFPNEKLTSLETNEKNIFIGTKTGQIIHLSSLSLKNKGTYMGKHSVPITCIKHLAINKCLAVGNSHGQVHFLPACEIDANGWGYAEPEKHLILETGIRTIQEVGTDPVLICGAEQKGKLYNIKQKCTVLVFDALNLPLVRSFFYYAQSQILFATMLGSVHTLSYNKYQEESG